MGWVCEEEVWVWARANPVSPVSACAGVWQMAAAAGRAFEEAALGALRRCRMVLGHTGGAGDRGIDLRCAGRGGHSVRHTHTHTIITH